jgi:hypothetical protein
MIFGGWIRAGESAKGTDRGLSGSGDACFGDRVGWFRCDWVCGIDNPINVTYTLRCDQLGCLVYQNSTYNRREYGND